MELSYTVKAEDNGKLLKDVAKRRLLLSNRLFNKLKLEHHIFINNNIAFANDILHKGDVIFVDFNYNEEDDIVPQKKNIKVLYEDDWYIAVEKESGIVVHPCSYHKDNTLANFVKYYLKSNKKIRPVNRLDKGTSGIVLFAKCEYAQERFKELDQESVTKEYIAIVEGKLENKEGTIDAPIARKEGSIIERCVDLKNGQKAITHYIVKKKYKYKDLNIKNKIYDSEDDAVSQVLVQLETGRTHQIRVHFSYINHPLVGDGLYNEKYKKYKDDTNQILHACKLEFIHPILNKKIIIKSDFNLEKFIKNS